MSGGRSKNNSKKNTNDDKTYVRFSVGSIVRSLRLSFAPSAGRASDRCEQEITLVETPTGRQDDRAAVVSPRQRRNDMHFADSHFGLLRRLNNTDYYGKR